MRRLKLSTQRSSRGSAAGFIILIIAVCLASFAIIYRQTIVDHVVALEFQPGPGVMQLATNAGMNNNGKFIYRASQPEIDTRSNFNAVCANKDAQTAVLGCYVNDRIYIYDVTDPQLAGIKTVTAAHEMLHAAYARLSPSERTHVDSMVEAAYQKLQGQDDLKARMAIYAKTEPGERDNELHSVLGTEIGNLPSDLENYYKQYFSDRAKVVAAHAAYQSVFTNLQSEASTIQTQMKQLQVEIESSSANYTAAVNQLNSDIQSFNKRAEAGDFASQADFTSARNALETRADSLATERDAVNALIDKYNSLNSKLAAIAEQDQQLNQNINSSLPAAPQV
ncbi:MAG TPA: hypothetical protein VFQ70_01915 [Candidatus Saccharimonadaceae bacterium]|nr:hypothetical protein [Candidatus Saccharimonadaceae bacterium]